MSSNNPSNNPQNNPNIFGYNLSSPPPYRPQFEGPMFSLNPMLSSSPFYPQYGIIPQQLFQQSFNPFQQSSSSNFNFQQTRSPPEQAPIQTDPEPKEPQNENAVENSDSSSEAEEPQPTQRRGRAASTKWTVQEETELARAWVDVSEDPKTGKNQQRDRFWFRVTRRFRKGMKKGKSYRNKDQCNTKWNNMNKCVMAFNAIYINLVNQWRSGESESKKNGNKSFKLEFGGGSGSKRSKTSESGSYHVSSDGHIGVNLNDDVDEVEEVEPSPPPRPMGRDRAKRKRKAISSTSSAGSRMEQYEEMCDEFKGLICCETSWKIIGIRIRPPESTVWDEMVVVHAKARNNRDLNAASIQISRESDKDKNGAVSQSILMVRQYQISRESIIDKNGAIRLLTELCSSYRLLNVSAG
ncbi:hypothetical protein L2E82_50490 [Cichorium intybus]|nr:hypothetical protein L2E82_50490 [Cichorium intybus]